jgi:hypothetical protein
MSTISQAVAWWCFGPEKLNLEQSVRAVSASIEAKQAAVMVFDMNVNGLSSWNASSR